MKFPVLAGVTALATSLMLGAPLLAQSSGVVET